MRIVSYNILDGGTDRLDLLGRVTEAQRPDVVCLVEAEDAGVVEKLADRLGMDFVHAPARKHASALLSRWTIRESVNHSLLQPALSKSLLEATVVDHAGEEWIFGVVHLHAGVLDADERRREAEVAAVLSVFATHRAAGTPHLLCGDFNANAPSQQIDPGRCKPKTLNAWWRNGGQIPRRVVQKLLGAGYVDALHAVLGPAADTLGTFTTDFPGQRVDYAFTYGIDPGRFGPAWADQSDDAKRASDHFPIGLELV